MVERRPGLVSYCAFDGFMGMTLAKASIRSIVAADQQPTRGRIIKSLPAAFVLDDVIRTDLNSTVFLSDVNSSQEARIFRILMM